MVLQDGLDILINRQDNRIAVLRIDVLVVIKGHFTVLRVLRAHQPPRLAAKLSIIGRLHPVGAHAVAVDHAQHLRCKRAVNIIAPRIRDKGNAITALILFNPLADGVAGVLVHTRLDILRLLGCVADLLQNSLVIEPQRLRQHAGDLFALLCLVQSGPILPRLRIRLVRVDRNAFGRSRFRKLVHVAVIDRAAAGRNDRVLRLVLPRLCNVELVAHDLHIEKPDGNSREADAAQHNHQHCDTAAHTPVWGVLIHRCHSMPSVCHRPATGPRPQRRAAGNPGRF